MNTNLGDAGRDINQDSIKDNFNTFNQQFMDFSTKIENYFKDCKREFENKFSTKSDIQSLERRIESLEQKITELTDKIKPPTPPIGIINCIFGSFKRLLNKIKPPAWLWILIASIGGAILFIIAMFFFQQRFGFEVSYENGNAITIVLAFVGIAATFVVVSNYAQVKDIEHKFEREIIRINSNFELESKKLQTDNYSNLAKTLMYQSITQFDVFQNPNLFLVGIDAITIALENNTNNIDWCINSFINKYKETKHSIDTYRLEFIKEAMNSTKYKGEGIKNLKEFINKLNVKEISH